MGGVVVCVWWGAGGRAVNENQTLEMKWPMFQGNEAHVGGRAVTSIKVMSHGRVRVKTIFWWMFIGKIRSDYYTACSANKHTPTDSERRLWYLNWLAPAKCFIRARLCANRYQWSLCPRCITTDKLQLKLQLQTATVSQAKDSPPPPTPHPRIHAGAHHCASHSQHRTVNPFSELLQLEHCPKMRRLLAVIYSYLSCIRPCQSGICCSGDRQRFTA